ncbi:hypothetical protein BJY01DRAFT_229049 [Aspergillus pseudoustus]|uniref:Secreted protein n=1 Tax=Aspergillus pseudoustus TaxID=1810923 RepID=A0ABR4IIB1_9EURO
MSSHRGPRGIVWFGLRTLCCASLIEFPSSISVQSCIITLIGLVEVNGRGSTAAVSQYINPLFFERPGWPVLVPVPWITSAFPSFPRNGGGKRGNSRPRSPLIWNRGSTLKPSDSQPQAPHSTRLPFQR